MGPRKFVSVSKPFEALRVYLYTFRPEGHMSHMRLQRAFMYAYAWGTVSLRPCLYRRM